MKVTVLGCGPSWGVPALGPDWGRCDPAEPRNRRRRCSLLVESRGSNVLIDMAPDLRQQLLDADVGRIDAVLLTHAHADHLHGIDDLRMASPLERQEIPLFGTLETLAEVEQRFGYALRPVPPGRRVYRPALTPHEIVGRFAAAGLPIVPFAQHHGYGTTTGFRIGALAYSTDVVELDETASRRWPGSSCGSSIACAAPPTRPTATSPRHWPGSRASSRAAPCSLIWIKVLTIAS